MINGKDLTISVKMFQKLNQVYNQFLMNFYINFPPRVQVHLKLIGKQDKLSFVTILWII